MWKKYKICDIATVLSGATPATSDLANYDGEIVWITPKDLALNNSKYISRGERNLTEKGYKGCSTQLIPPYNILMSSRAPIGLLAINRTECCTNQGFKNLVIDKSICDVDFFYYYLKYHIAEVQALGSGTTFKEVSKSSLQSFVVSLPSLDEQKQIANILSTLDEKIALNRQINDNLEAMAKQLYDYWFVQFDFPNEEGKPYKSSGGAMVWNDKLKREIPQGWSNGVLSDVANITMGQSPDGSSYNEDGEGIIFYQGSTDFGLRFPNIRQYTTSPSRYANKGDILMSVRAPVGALNIANNDCCIGRGLSALSSKIGSMTHLYYLMNDFRLKFEGMNSAGTTFGSITKDELFSLPVIIPTKSVISEFEQVCEPIFDKQMIIGEEINALTKQRDELLPLLMNGQASVNYHLSFGILFVYLFLNSQNMEYVWQQKIY